MENKSVESKSIKQYKATLSVVCDKQYKIQADDREEAMRQAVSLLESDLDFLTGARTEIKLECEGYHEKANFRYWLIKT